MQTQMLADAAEKAPWLTVHPLSQADSPAATALRAAVAPFKGKLGGTAARAPFDDVMEALRTLDKKTNAKDSAHYRRLLRRGRLGQRPRPPSIERRSIN